MDNINLGGNIVLSGFEELEYMELIVVKKIIGSFAKELREKTSYEELLVKLSRTDEYKISVLLKADNEFSSTSSDNNLFYAISNSFIEINKKIKN